MSVMALYTRRSKISALIVVSAIMLSLMFYQVPTPDFSYWPWWVVMLAFIVIGLPHGALDWDMFQRQQPSVLMRAAFLSAYALIAVTMFALWLWQPALCFSAFIAMSIWHFRHDWQQYMPLNYSGMMGLFILSAPAIFQVDALLAYLQLLLIPKEAAMLILVLMQLCFIISGLVFVWAQLQQKLRPCVSLIAEITALFVVLALTNILVYFMLFFCVLHSLWYFDRYATFFNVSPMHMAKQAAPILVLTLILGAGIYAGLSNGWAVDVAMLNELGIKELSTNELGTFTSNDGLVMIFVGLFALTIPHMLLVERFINHP